MWKNLFSFRFIFIIFSSSQLHCYVLCCAMLCFSVSSYSIIYDKNFLKMFKKRKRRKRNGKKLIIFYVINKILLDLQSKMEQAAAVVATTIEQLSSIFMTKTSTLMMERKDEKKASKFIYFCTIHKWKFSAVKLSSRRMKDVMNLLKDLLNYAALHLTLFLMWKFIFMWWCLCFSTNKKHHTHNLEDIRDNSVNCDIKMKIYSENFPIKKNFPQSSI